MNEARIRTAIEADLKAIGLLWEELMDFHAERDETFTRCAGGRDSFVEHVGTCISSEQWHVLVAERDGELLGYCLACIKQRPPVFEVRDFGSIDDLLVAAAARREGLGERFVREAEQWFKDAGISRVELRIAVTNEVSSAFWRKMGYTPYMETAYRALGD